MILYEGAAVPLPLKGAAGPLPLKGLAGPLPLKGCALTKIGSANASIPFPFPSKKRTSHERFVSTSGVRSENQSFPIWRNENESLFYPKRSEAIK